MDEFEEGIGAPEFKKEVGGWDDAKVIQMFMINQKHARILREELTFRMGNSETFLETCKELGFPNLQ